jgi:Fe2+ or Zn2+ uptake regulation protein
MAEAFRARGIRLTAQRMAVMEFIAAHPVHATAEEVFRAVNQREPRASRATIYNNLNALAGAGLVREVALDGNAVRFDANVERHHHFVCERCGKLEDIGHFELPDAARRGALGAREVSGYEIVFRGVCESCSRSGHRMK